MKFYTNAVVYKNKILVTGYKDGKRFADKVSYKPYLFVNSQQPSKYKTVDGKDVSRIDFDSINDARDFIKEYKDVDGFDIYGLDKFLYTYLYDEFKNTDYDSTLISIGYIDIETTMLNNSGFPDIQQAENEVTAITLSKNSKKHVFACKPYDNDDANVTFYLCGSEQELLLKFVSKWQELDFDIITGWNIEFFDIPYLINRITALLGKEIAQRLSPWGVLQERSLEIMGKDTQVYIPLGISTLDYYQLYKKFAYTQQESYKLDHIAQEELGEKKLEFEGTLADLERDDWQNYIRYNVKDVYLVERLNAKLGLIELVLAMAYDAGVTYQDTFTTVNLWDVLIHNYLLDQDIVVPPFKHKRADRSIVGGYVKDSQVGLHEWVVSFDLTSLYPKIIEQYNISPETFIGFFPHQFTVDTLLDGFMNDHRGYLVENNCTVAANMCMFSKEKQGFLPAIMSKLFGDRKLFKNKMLNYERQYESTQSADIKTLVIQLDNKQQAKKIQLNSGYGALANEFFRWFEANYAEAITMSGQLSVRWVENALNELMNKLFKTTGVDYVIACDTDSVYIKADKFAAMCKSTNKDDIIAYLDKLCNESIAPFLDKKYEELGAYMNVYTQAMNMKRECIADRGIFIAKKRYIMNVWNKEGVAYSEPKLKMMGIEAIRSSTPHVCRDAIKDSLKIIMGGTEDQFHSYIAKFRTEFSQMTFQEVAFPRSVNEMEKWEDKTTLFKKGTPINVKGALVYNFYLKKMNLTKKYEPINNGQKIKFSYLRVPNPLHSTVITCPDKLPNEFGLDKYIDRDMQFEKTFLQPIINIVDKIGWSVEPKNTLESFFE